MDENGEDDLFNHLFRTKVRWLLMAKRLYVCKANSKVAMWWKILLVTVILYYKKYLLV